MKILLEFLADLRLNNNRDWFEANRGRYNEVKKQFEAFATELIERLGRVDPAVAGLTLRDCTYRIYRDTRFSNDKTPYKTHMGVYVCPGGKKSGYAGYYFHIEPQREDGGGHLLTSGLYMPEGNVLRSLREEIADHGDLLAENLKKARGFALDMSNSLKRLPKGFEPGSGHDEWLRLKDFYVTQRVGDEWLLGEGLAERAVREFSKTTPLLSQLNRAVRFAYEEM